MWQMICTGRNYCDFVSFDPRFPEHLQLCVIRVDRDAQRCADLESEVVVFLAEVAEMVAKLLDMKVAA